MIQRLSGPALALAVLLPPAAMGADVPVTISHVRVEKKTNTVGSRKGEDYLRVSFTATTNDHIAQDDDHGGRQGGSALVKTDDTRSAPLEAIEPGEQGHHGAVFMSQDLPAAKSMDLSFALEVLEKRGQALEASADGAWSSPAPALSRPIGAGSVRLRAPLPPLNHPAGAVTSAHGREPVLARLYLLMLAITTAAARDLRVPYETAPRSASSLTLYAAIPGAFCRRWRHFRPGAPPAWHHDGSDEPDRDPAATLLPSACTPTSTTLSPRGVTPEASFSQAMLSRFAGLIVNPILTGIAAAIGWAMDGLLPES